MTRTNCFALIWRAIFNSLQAPFTKSPAVRLNKAEEKAPLCPHEKGPCESVSEVSNHDDESIKSQETIPNASLISLCESASGSDINALRTTGHHVFKTLGDDALRILLVCIFLDNNSISMLVLHRGALLQPRWSRDGNAEGFLITEGRDSNLLEVLSDLTRLRRGIYTLLGNQNVSCHYKEGELESIAIEEGFVNVLRASLEANYAAYWSEQALLTVCNAFPKDKHVSSEFRSFGQLCLGHYDTALGFFETFHRGSVVHESLHEEIVTAGIAATFFSTLEWKLDKLERIRPYATRHFLDILVATRRKTLLRMNREFVYGSRPNAMVDSNGEHDPRTNAQVKLSLISDAWDFIEESRYDEAIAHLMSVLSEIGQPSSNMEELAEFQAKLGIARCRRLQNEFHEALDLIRPYTQLATMSQLLKPHHQQIVVEEADLLCQLGQPGSANVVLEAHIPVVAGASPLWDRRLRLALADSFIQLERLDDAQRLLLQLLDDFESSHEISRTARLRLHCSMARVYHLQQLWRDARGHWDNALVLAAQFSHTDGQITAMIYGSMAHAFYMEKNLQHAQVMAKASYSALHAGCKEEFWIVGLNDFWHRYAEPELPKILASGHESDE